MTSIKKEQDNNHLRLCEQIMGFEGDLMRVSLPLSHFWRAGVTPYWLRKVKKAVG